MTLQEILNNNDRFASVSGIQLVDIKEGYAKAQMTVADNHMNAGNVCQGGAIFTLADLAMAGALNSRKQLTFGIQSSISFLKSAMLGDTLTAEAQEVVNHPKIPFLSVTVKNQDGDIVAIVTGQGYRKKSDMNFDNLI